MLKLNILCQQNDSSALFLTNNLKKNFFKTIYNPLVLKLFLFQFYLRCYSSFTPDNCYMYLSFSLFYFINIFIVNVFLYELKKVILN